MYSTLETPLGLLNFYLSGDCKYLTVARAGPTSQPQIYQEIHFHNLRVNVTLKRDGSCCLGALRVNTRYPNYHYVPLNTKDCKIIRGVLIDIVNQWWNSPAAERLLKSALQGRMFCLGDAIKEQSAVLEASEEELKEIVEYLDFLSQKESVDDHSALNLLLK